MKNKDFIEIKDLAFSKYTKVYCLSHLYIKKDTRTQKLINNSMHFYTNTKGGKSGGGKKGEKYKNSKPPVILRHL